MTEKTRAIKMRLQEYADMRREYEIQLERLDRLRASVDYKSPSFEQMPKGGGFKDKMVEHVARVEELEEAMGKDFKTMQDERKYLDGLIKELPKADEREVIRMKYFYRMGWIDITGVLFFGEPDYKTTARTYLQRTYKLHGSALVSLAKIYNGSNR